MALNWRKSALYDTLRLFGACFLDMREAPRQGGLLPNVGVVTNIVHMVCGKLEDYARGGLPETPEITRTWRCWGHVTSLLFVPNACPADLRCENSLGDSVGCLATRAIVQHVLTTCCSSYTDLRPHWTAPTVGLEPTTTRLRALRSAD